MSIHDTSRDRDEIILGMMAARETRDCADIAVDFETTQEAVRVATNRVLNADSAEEGLDVSAEYGWLSKSAAMRIASNRYRADMGAGAKQ